MPGAASGWWGRRSPVQRMALVAVAVVVGASAFVLFGEARTPPNRPSVNATQAQAFRREAFGACRGFVSDHLEQPATAVYPERNVQVVRGARVSEWVVSGSVESQTGFGLSLRQRYVCTMLTNFGGRWTAEHVTFSQ